MIFRPAHPQAIAAIKLAKLLRGAPPDMITRILNESGVRRRLFVVASGLEAQKGWQSIGGSIDVYA